MKRLRKVTILVVPPALLALIAGCGSGGRQVAPPVAEEQPVEVVQVDESAFSGKLAAGIGLYQAGDLEEAGASFDEILRECPNHVEALRFRGYLDEVRFCTVYPGDTLSGIAAYYYGDKDRWSMLARANRIDDPKRLQSYQRLRLPWFPECSPEKDEIGRLQRGGLKGVRVEKVLVVPAKKGQSLRSLAIQHYRDEQFRYLIADFNRLEELGPPQEGASLRIPVFKGTVAPAGRDQGEAALRDATMAMEQGEFEEAFRVLGAVPDGSGSRAEAERLLARCRTEGEAYYQRLGDQSFEASDPRRACGYWEQALALNPANREVRRKLDEARDLLTTLDKLPGLQ